MPLLHINLSSQQEKSNEFFVRKRISPFGKINAGDRAFSEMKVKPNIIPFILLYAQLTSKISF